MDLPTTLIAYAAVGLAILLVAGLIDKGTRRAVVVTAMWSLFFAVAWPLFVLIFIGYHAECYCREC